MIFRFSIRNTKNEQLEKDYFYHLICLSIFFIILSISPLILSSENFLNYKLTNSQIRKSKSALKFGMKILNEKNQNPYELGLKALNSYFIRKFALDEKLLDSYELKNILKNNISDSLLERTMNVLRSCEEYKYGGFDVKSLDDDFRGEIESIMKNIEKQIK